MRTVCDKKLVWAMLLGTALFARDVTARNVVAIFAPGEYQHLENAKHQLVGAARLKSRFTGAGHVVEVLSHRDATRDNLRDTLSDLAGEATQDDTFIVVMQSYGVRKHGKDYFHTFNSNPDGHSAKAFIGVEEVMNWMQESPSANRLLVIDSARPNETTWRFGKKQNQDTKSAMGSCESQPSHPKRPIGIHSVTCSMASSGTAIRTVMESSTRSSLLPYVQDYAADQDLPMPLILGKSANFSIVAVDDHQQAGLPLAARTHNVRKLRSTAERALFNDLDPLAALNYLDRAARLRPEGDSRTAIDELRLTAEGA